MHRALDGEVLLHHLGSAERLIDPVLLARHGRSARTLVKAGALRVTVLGIRAGEQLPTHRAEGPVTIQVLAGAAVFEARGREYPVVAGDLLMLEGGVEHSARARTDTQLLLTMVHAPPARETPPGE